MNSQSNHVTELNSEFRKAISNELSDAIRKLRHCLDQLSEEQIWWRPSESMNSIANLILHLCGNLRQWIVAGLSDTPDQRNRRQEFAQRQHIPAEQLSEMLDAVEAEVRQTLDALADEDLLRVRTIQGYEVSGMQAAIDSIAHFRGHTQEITHLTRIQLEDAYQFDFVPRPDQQGGAAD